MFMYWPGESIVRLSDQSDSKFSDSGLLIGNGIRIGFHAARVKREEETVLAFRSCGKVDDGCPPAIRHVANGLRQAIESLSAPWIWVERREHQPSNPCLYCRHLAGVAFGPRSCPPRPCGYESPWTRMFPLFGFQVSSPTVRAVACDGMRPRSRRSPMRAVYAFRPACIDPYASGDAYVFLPRFGLVPTFRGWSGACMHCMHSFPYRGFEKKEGNPLY